MKIIHVASTPNGAPWMIAIAREQKKLGHDVAVIIPSLDGNIAPELASAGIQAYAAPVDGLLYAPSHLARIRSLIRIVRLLRRLRPDVLHSHIFASVVASRIASWIADVPIHLAGNVHPISLESTVMRAFEVGTAFCDTKTIASSSYTRDLYIEHGVPADQVELIFYAVDQSGHDPALVDATAARRNLGIRAETPVIGKIAYFYPPSKKNGTLPKVLHGRGMKGHDVFLRAMSDVLASVPDAKFVIVGRGWGPDGAAYERTLRDLATTLGVDHAVLFAGETDDVPAMLAAFDVSVHCSLSDNLAGTVESLLMERPMVVSDIRGFADTIIHEETGLVVPMDDPPALAAAIVRLLRDRQLAQRLGKEGRARMLSRFTLARTVADIEALLSRLPDRAKSHYRVTRTVARTLAAPFRLLPVAFRAWRALMNARALEHRTQ
jgi:glycosyltransferase involved in cell wall biosynthesis